MPWPPLSTITIPLSLRFRSRYRRAPHYRQLPQAISPDIRRRDARSPLSHRREQEVSTRLAPLKQLLLRVGKRANRRLHCRCQQVTGRAPRNYRRQLARTKTKRARGKSGFAFGRRFKSTDGYEIVVGRNDRDNDALTFRVAKPNDIWLHAADYPGSHAIIRNPTREAPPHRTITEAAELAAFYSQAKREGKAAVHYAQKKFVSKPPRSKPGLGPALLIQDNPGRTALHSRKTRVIHQSNPQDKSATKNKN